MKLVFSRIICIMAILSVLNGCSSTEPSEKSVVNSGALDESYVGDANVQLTEDYKQTQVEAQIQADTLKKIEEKETITNGEDLGGHF